MLRLHPNCFSQTFLSFFDACSRLISQTAAFCTLNAQRSNQQRVATGTEADDLEWKSCGVAEVDDVQEIGDAVELDYFAESAYSAEESDRLVTMKSDVVDGCHYVVCQDSKAVSHLCVKIALSENSERQIAEGSYPGQVLDLIQ